MRGLGATSLKSIYKRLHDVILSVTVSHETQQAKLSIEDLSDWQEVEDNNSKTVWIVDLFSSQHPS